MANFLDNLTKKGDEVYITVSAAGGLEMILKDSESGGIKSYAQMALDYNEMQREFVNFEDFKNAIDKLAQATGATMKGATVRMTMPLVWFGYKDNLPMLLDNTAVTNTILGELEQTYIFKKRDPIPYWFEALNINGEQTETKSVFYTAIQNDVAEKLESYFKELGAELVKIGCSLIEELKGLNQAGIASDELMSGSRWQLMIINNTGFQMYGMFGSRIIESYEEPLPIRTYEDNEIYSEIGNAAQISLMSSEAQTLVILSETDLVSAELLSKNLQFKGTIKVVDDNKFKQEPITELSLNISPENRIKITLGMIGLVSPEIEGAIRLNFLNTADNEEEEEGDATLSIPLGNGQYIVLTPEKATILTGILMLAVAILIGGVFLISLTLKNNVQDQTNKLNNQITDLDNQIKTLTAKENEANTGFDPIATIEEVLKVNRTKIIAYSALGISIPKNIYLTYFVIGNNGSLNVKGCAKTVEDVYIFFKNLKDSVPNSNLRLNKLDLRAGSLDALINDSVSQFDNAPYAFEITNMDPGQLALFGLLPAGAQKKEEKPKEPEKQKRLTIQERRDMGEEG